MKLYIYAKNLIFESIEFWREGYKIWWIYIARNVQFQGNIYITQLQTHYEICDFDLSSTHDT